MDRWQRVDGSHVQKRARREQQGQGNKLFGRLVEQLERQQRGNRCSNREHQQFAMTTRCLFVHGKHAKAECCRNSVQDYGNRHQQRERRLAGCCGGANRDPVGSRMHRQTNRKHGRRRWVMHMCVPVSFDVIVMFFVDGVTDAKSFEKQHDHETKQDCESKNHGFIHKCLVKSCLMSDLGSDMKSFRDHDKKGRRQKQPGSNTSQVFEGLI